MTQQSSSKPSLSSPSNPSEFEDLSSEIKEFSQTLFEGAGEMSTSDPSSKSLQFRPPTGAMPTFRPPSPPPLASASSGPMALLDEDVGESTSMQPSTLLPPAPPSYVEVGESTALEASLFASSNKEAAASVAVRMLDPESPPSPPRPSGSSAPVATSASNRPNLPPATASPHRPPPPPPNPRNPFAAQASGGFAPSPMNTFPPQSSGGFAPQPTGTFQGSTPSLPQPSGAFSGMNPFTPPSPPPYASPSPYGPHQTGSFAPSNPLASPQSPFAAPSSNPFPPMQKGSPPASSVSSPSPRPYQAPATATFDDGDLHEEEDDEDFPAERSEATVIDSSMLQAFQTSLRTGEPMSVSAPAPLFSSPPSNASDVLSPLSQGKGSASFSLFRSPTSLPDPSRSGLPATQMPIAEGLEISTATIAEPVHTSSLVAPKKSKLIPLLAGIVVLLSLAIAAVLVVPSLMRPTEDSEEKATDPPQVTAGRALPQPPAVGLPLPPPRPALLPPPPSRPDASASPDVFAGLPESQQRPPESATPEPVTPEPVTPEPASVAIRNVPPVERPDPSDLPEELQPRSTPSLRRVNVRSPEPSRRTEPVSRRPSERNTKVALRPSKRRAAPAGGSDLGITGAVIEISPSCQLFLDDQKLGQADKRLFPLKPGSHSFRCSNPQAFFTHSFKLTVTPGQITSYQRSFRKGTLVVTTKPWSAVYLKDFGKIGKSGDTLSLYEGKYNLLLYKKGTKIAGPGYEQKLSVSILPGQSARPATVNFPIFDDEGD